MELKTDEWKPFFLKDLYDIEMGNKFDKNKICLLYTSDAADEVVKV